MNTDQLSKNCALLQNSKEIQDVPPSVVLQELAVFLSSPTNLNGIPQKNPLSAPLQKKLITLVNCQLDEEKGRICAMKTARYLGERSLKDLILQHQNPQQLSTDLFTAVRARGCQFLGPALQEEALKLVLLALEDGSGLSRKVLVMFVLQRLVPEFPHASKTSVGNVVQLLYRASCFKIVRRENDSSLLYLKEEYHTYEALRRKHDTEMVQIAIDAGLYISPEQWSSLLYGDTVHYSYMQSIIAKLQTPQSFSRSIDELVIILQRRGDPRNLFALKPHLELLAGIDADPPPPSPEDLKLALKAAKVVVKGLVDFIQYFVNQKIQEKENKQNVESKVPCCAFDGLSISEISSYTSPVIDSSVNNHFSSAQVSNVCSLSDFSSLSDCNSPLHTAVHVLSPESHISSPLAKLPRAILKQSSQETLLATDTSCPKNIDLSYSTVGVTPDFATELLAAKLKPSNNYLMQQSVKNPPYFSNDSVSSIDTSLQNRAMPVHYQDSFTLKSKLENNHCDSNRNLATALQRKEQLQTRMFNFKKVSGCLSGLENNGIATNVENTLCFLKDDNESFHTLCTSKRKIKGRYGSSSINYNNSKFTSLNPPYNEFNSIRAKVDSDRESFTPAIFCPSDEDEFIPFEPTLVSKYGHISRCSQSLLCSPPACQVNNSLSKMGEFTTTTFVAQHSLPSSSLTSTFCAVPSPNSAVPTAIISDQYAPVIESASVLMTDAVSAISFKADDDCNQ